jgi:hypothetical protein
MQGGGSIKGYLVDDQSALNVEKALEALGDIESFNRKYSLSETKPLVYAMGDGNHSLATAKEFYEQLKAAEPDKDLSSHPARYALVEIVNLHSEALRFEAIHRIVTGVEPKVLLDKLTARLKLSDEQAEQKITVVQKGVHRDLYIHQPLNQVVLALFKFNHATNRYAINHVLACNRL